MGPGPGGSVNRPNRQQPSNPRNSGKPSSGGRQLKHAQRSWFSGPSNWQSTPLLTAVRDHAKPMLQGQKLNIHRGGPHRRSQRQPCPSGVGTFMQDSFTISRGSHSLDSRLWSSFAPYRTQYVDRPRNLARVASLLYASRGNNGDHRSCRGCFDLLHSNYRSTTIRKAPEPLYDLLSMTDRRNPVFDDWAEDLLLSVWLSSTHIYLSKSSCLAVHVQAD